MTLVHAAKYAAQEWRRFKLMEESAKRAGPNDYLQRIAYGQRGVVDNAMRVLVDEAKKLPTEMSSK